MTRLQPLQQYLGNANDQRQCGRCNHSCSHKQKQSDSPRPLRSEPATVPRPSSGRQIALSQPALRACCEIFKLVSASPAVRHAIAKHDAPMRMRQALDAQQKFCSPPCTREQTSSINNPEDKEPACLTERGLHPDTVFGSDEAVTGSIEDLLPEYAHELRTRPCRKSGRECEQDQDHAHHTGECE